MPRPPSPHPPPGRRARRKLEMRARILSAALDLFAQQGFFDTTVEQITEAADVGKGTFFNYFPSKEHVLAGFGEMQVARIEHALTEARRGGKPVEGILRRLAHSLTEEPGRSQSLVRSLMTANLSSEPVRHLFRHNLARGRRGVARILTLGQQRGEVRRDLGPATHARIFQQLILGTILLWTIHPPSSLDKWVDPSFEVFWRAIAVPKGGKR